MFPSCARQDSGRSDSSTASSSDYTSTKGSVPNSVPSLDHHSVESSFESPQDSSLFDTNPCSSANTYCTTVASCDDGEDDGDKVYNCYSPYQMATPPPPPPPCITVPATPQEFAEHFPSTKRLIIKHDESMLDGNMNVRVEVDAPTQSDRDRRITLFHMRMYDLRDRDFSVRRYGRDCGREVAHIKRKLTKVSAQRPTLRKALSGLTGEFKRIERVDSGYASSGFDDEEPERKVCSAPAKMKATNTCTLEFSNYAHVDITRRGSQSSKRYEFEYWGKSYSWRRVIQTIKSGEYISYQLFNNATGNVVAFIRPDELTPEMAAYEDAKGDIVPQSSMIINNSHADPINSDNADVADVIVTTGLVMLADDCIKRKYHKRKSVQLVFPTAGRTTLKMNMEYVGPKRFIDEIFHRKPAISRSQSAQLNNRMSAIPPPRRMHTN